LDVDEAALAALYDETRAAAHEEGYQAGCEEGRIAGEEAGQVAVEEELATLGSIRAQLEAELSSLTALRRNLLRDAEIDCVELALRVGKRLASDAQLGSTSWVEPLVRAASLALTHGDRVVCHVGIDLADRLERSGAVIDLEGAVIERNHDLGPLDVVVETESARVNAGIEARFDELREAILARVARVPVDETTP
jgi:flagellar biosynthesis/type III secretory pathway protein FliH